MVQDIRMLECRLLREGLLNICMCLHLHDHAACMPAEVFTCKQRAGDGHLEAA